MKTFREIALKYINEKEKTVGIFSGRFQPATLAHSNIIDTMSKENDKGIIFLVKGKKSSEDKDKNPFDAEIQKKMLELIAPKNVEVRIISSGFFVGELNKMQEDNFVAYAGTDRLTSYERMASYMEEGKTLKVKEIKRTNEDISATKVRESLRDGNEEMFKKLTNPKMHKMYNELKDILGEE